MDAKLKSFARRAFGCVPEIRLVKLMNKIKC